MTAIKKKFANVQFFLKEVWPYYKHPRWILRLERDRDYYRSIVENYTREALRDEIVEQLQTELSARKAAYDEAEEQFDEEIEDLRQELATVYAKNADLWARIAKLLAGDTSDAVQTETASADC